MRDTTSNGGNAARSGHHDSAQQRRERRRIHRKSVGTDRFDGRPDRGFWRFEPFEPIKPSAAGLN